MSVTAPPRARARAPVSRRRTLVSGVVIAAALGFLVFRAVGDATVYFKTADEAVAQRQKLGSHRFRLEGMVVAGTAKDGRSEVDFTIRGEQGATVTVQHTGDVPELFQPDIPVVLEGRFVGASFVSDRMLVKHTNEYKAKNPARVQDYPGPR